VNQAENPNQQARDTAHPPRKSDTPQPAGAPQFYHKPPRRTQRTPYAHPTNTLRTHSKQAQHKRQTVAKTATKRATQPACVEGQRRDTADPARRPTQGQDARVHRRRPTQDARVHRRRPTQHARRSRPLREQGLGRGAVDAGHDVRGGWLLEAHAPAWGLTRVGGSESRGIARCLSAESKTGRQRPSLGSGGC